MIKLSVIELWKFVFYYYLWNNICKEAFLVNWSENIYKKLTSWENLNLGPFDPKSNALPLSYECLMIGSVFFSMKINGTKTFERIYANLSVLNWTFVFRNNRVLILSTVKKNSRKFIEQFSLVKIFCDRLEFSNLVLHPSSYGLSHFEKLFFFLFLIKQTTI